MIAFRGLKRRGFEPEYQAVLDRATALGYTKPTTAQQIKHNTLLKALKTAGIWTRLDMLQVYANNGSKEFATLNWKNPLTYQATMVNSPTWTSNQGFKGNGASAYVDTNFDISTGTNYTQNDASRFVWVTTANSGAIILGAKTSSRDAMTCSDSSTAQRINQSTTSTTAMAGMDGAGLKAFNRTGANALSHYVNTTNYTRTTASAAIVSDTITINKLNTTHSICEVGIIGMGANLASYNTDLYNALNTYMSSP